MTSDDAVAAFCWHIRPAGGPSAIRSAPALGLLEADGEAGDEIILCQAEMLQLGRHHPGVRVRDFIIADGPAVMFNRFAFEKLGGRGSASPRQG